MPTLFWAALTAIHLPVLAASLTPFLAGTWHAGSVATLLLVLASVAFFVLKLVDLPALRFRRRGRATLAFTVIAALIHGDALVGSVGEPAVLEVASVVLVAEAVRRFASRRLGRWFAHLIASLHGLAIRLQPQWRELGRLGPPPLEPALVRSTGSRAPPA